jgi:hypothetical protein
VNRAQNEKRARARATGEIRRKCITIGADHLVTFTYRDNVDNREKVLGDLERLRRRWPARAVPSPTWPCWSAKSAGRSIRI